MRSHTQRLMVCCSFFRGPVQGSLRECGSDTASSGGDSGEVVNLTYMHRLPDSEGMTLVKDIVAKWNKDHPNIQVKATKFDGAAQDMIKKLETDVKAGNAEVPEVFTKGLLEDVTEEAAKYKSDFAEGPYSMMQVDGKTYGLPPGHRPACVLLQPEGLRRTGHQGSQDQRRADLSGKDRGCIRQVHHGLRSR